MQIERVTLEQKYGLENKIGTGYYPCQHNVTTKGGGRSESAGRQRRRGGGTLAGSQR